MPLDEKRCEIILARMRSISLEDKLTAINEAKSMYASLFAPDMSDVEYAKSAMLVFQFYNIVRDELQLKLVSAKNGGEDSAPVAKVKQTASKKVKEKPKAMDMATMMAAFLESKNRGELG